MKLLAIDTSTEACSAALAIGCEIYERFELAPRRHSELILPMVDQLLGEAGLSVGMLDGLAFGRGPGSFTGIRIATGVIQGIAFGADLPVAPISTLAALAQGAYQRFGQSNILAAIDARIGEIYWGIYQVDGTGVMRASQDEYVCRADAAPLPLRGNWFGVGSGWQAYSTVLKPRLGGRLVDMEPEYYPHAREIAILAIDAFNRGYVVKAEEALPVYLREEVVNKPAKGGLNP